jgi:hypothetical protein
VILLLGNGGKFDPSVIPTNERQTATCRVSKSTSQSIPNSTGTIIIFDTVEFDSDNMYDTVNPSRLVIPSDGVYQIMGQVIFSLQASAGVRAVGILANGSITIGNQGITTNGANTFGINVGSIYNFKKGDYIEMNVYQTSGGALDITSDNNTGITSFSAYKISD